MNTSVRFASAAYNRNQERQENIRKRLQRLEESTNYPIIQINGQRICGPPNDWNRPIPSEGSEIFIGNLPRWILEDELMEIFSVVGNIYMIRVMVDFTGFNRGFAFLTYESSEKAKMAVRYLNNFLIRSNHSIGVYMSVDNRRLFIGGIPADKTKEEVKIALNHYVEELVDIIMYPSHSNGIHNRGYVFAEFKTHRSAAIARRLLNFDVKLWTDASSLSVDWADPIPEMDPRIMETIKRLYVRNLPIELTNEELWLYISQYINVNTITRVHKIKDYAFIHFENKRDAKMALSILNGLTIKDKEIEVAWSRPKIYSKSYRMNRPIENLCKSVPPRMRRKLQALQNSALPASTSAGSSSPGSSSTHSSA